MKDMKECPKCKSKKLVKNGFQSGKQRYKCKDCGFNPSVEEVGYPKAFRAKVIRAYLEGVGIRALSRIFEIGIATVIDWIKQAAKELPAPEKPKSIQVMELDEMHHWIGEKKTQDGYGLQFAVLPVKLSSMKWVVVEYLQEESYGQN